MIKLDDEFRKKWHDIIFEADTPEGKLFDVVLLGAIFISVILVSLETIPAISGNYRILFSIMEWLFTLLFTAEYIMRIYTVNKPWRYITSFYGIVDLLSIIPSYLTLFAIGSHSFMIIRALRLLRIFRIFKMGHYLKQGNIILAALRSSSPKIMVFLYFIVLVVCIFGAMMYLVEGETNPGFDSIPRSIYWSIVTLTTVGFGDITPQTVLGQTLASILMITGYAVIAVPTGIVSNEMIKASSSKKELPMNTQHCSNCSFDAHDDDAAYCKKCGYSLSE